ncbi:hypothetical protein E4T43_09305 [Aureobasidium subglaciale]|nr:hypothetical protein E4T43_09305 [Aureobasidium subglaciale]
MVVVTSVTTPHLLKMSRTMAIEERILAVCLVRTRLTLPQPWPRPFKPVSIDSLALKPLATIPPLCHLLLEGNMRGPRYGDLKAAHEQEKRVKKSKKRREKRMKRKEKREKEEQEGEGKNDEEERNEVKGG